VTAAMFLPGIALYGLDLRGMVQTAATHMLNGVVEGIGIALLAWVLLRGLGRQNSGTRFAVWYVALLAVAALPLLGHGDSRGAGLVRPPEIALPASWAIYLFAGWAMLAAVGTLRVGIGLWHVRRLRQSCAPVDLKAVDPLLRKTLQEFDSPRPVAICVSDALPGPTAIGFIRPLVIIPSWAMRELSAAELNTIVLHELAHLRRWDDWTNLIQKVVGALFFFHPAVWWIEKKLALEREMACDDLVLAKTVSPQAYAECLVSLAEVLAKKSLLRRGFALAQAAVGRVRHISLRVAQILDEKRPGATRVWRPAPGLLMGISLACLMALSDTPRLVSFENSSPVSATPPAAGASTAAVPPKAVGVESRDAPQSSAASAQVIPASFSQKDEAKLLAPARKRTRTSSVAKPDKSAVVPARGVQSPLSPRLIRSSLTGDGPTPQTLIFIMQTSFLQNAADGASGVVIWKYCVWQVTVAGTANAVEQEIIVKSI
jgi:hypothetical protein